MASIAASWTGSIVILTLIHSIQYNTIQPHLRFYSSLLFFFSRFVPESVRWLNLNGQTEKAMAILRRIAKFNKRTIPDHVTLKPATVEGVQEKASPLDLFRPPKMALRTAVQAFAW